MKIQKIIVPAIVIANLLVPANAAIPSDWGLIWSDEFDGDSLDLTKWKRVDAGTPDWRKFTSLDEDLVEFRDGCLVLKGTKDSADSSVRDYRQAAVSTQGLFSTQYGKIEVRAKYTCAQGVWPAIWMMPNVSGTWPENGEIDIMEHLNWEGSIYQTLHYWDSNGASTSVSAHPNFAGTGTTGRDDWHTYAIEWTEGQIVFLIDDITTATFTSNSTNWPFDEEENAFYIILSMQIGGSWVESAGDKGIDSSTIYNSGVEMAIDYVRVYGDVSAIPEASLFGLFAGIVALGLAGTRRRRERGGAGARERGGKL